MFDEMSFSKMKDLYFESYTSIFTTDELHALVAFYETPAGRAYVEKLPALTKRMMGLAQDRMQKLQPEVKRLNDEFFAEAKRPGRPR